MSCSYFQVIGQVMTIATHDMTIATPDIGVGRGLAIVIKYFFGGRFWYKILLPDLHYYTISSALAGTSPKDRGSYCTLRGKHFSSLSILVTRPES